LPTIFVSGVPETSAVWDEVRSRLDRESTALALPGFGCPRPDGFDSTMDTYADWLRGELDAADGPVDLVGHDWGGILAARIATHAPRGLRSWASDGAAAVFAGFTWHDFARIWQTPGEGEAFWDGLRAAPEDSVALFASLGIPEHHAAAMVAALDETMVDSILRLYRSATAIGEEWAAEGPSPVPGLLVVGANDAFGDEGRSRNVAGRLGAEVEVEVIDGGGHWWPLDSPDAAAAALEAFWSRLP